MVTPPLSDELLAEAVKGYAEHGNNMVHAAAALGIAPSTLRTRLKIAARSGMAPGHWTSGTAPGFIVDRVNITRGKDGVERTHERQVPEGQLDASAIPTTHIKGRLTVTSGPNGIERIHQRYMPDEARQAEAMRAAAEAMAEALPRLSPERVPNLTLKHLLTLYTFTDFHLGALCWHKEGGADWDVKIAEAVGMAAMQAMVAQSPPADTGVVSFQGDFMHWDGLLPVTPGHGHVLDADSRFGKVVEVAIRLIRQLVSLALQKHRNVRLLILEGNHDISSSLWLRKLFGALYENEPRVAVHDSELPYFAFAWGNTMLGFHHGHLKKNDQLPAFFADQFRSMWGGCSKVYIHTGHRHHKEDKEHSGARVIQHPTLAAKDAYAARGGWLSERAITAVTYHNVFGEVGTTTITPEMLAA
ncbi:hypothetical protein [Sphingomonas sp. 10B4]|uniref:hypothetical protein n=1 Tax=Sphingomonas sp. 10B4 TaxID=3048575 RepID=UPI002AB50274|nr:hypothetical protein [Sphingomonas sp. 10B4]MDY7525472.1 hypothetical protein [Sphingomonas sp. 10B4]MEB0281416.1 hypothetical protein [Sphingomonas sp. 10B4]